MRERSLQTLLVIDDDPILCDTIKDYLSSEECHVMTANSGQAGLEICSKYRIDIILLDQKLPDGEGYLLCPEILSHNENAKIIFITAYSSFDNAINAIQAGAYDYLSKPFELEQLELTIRKAVQYQKLERIGEFQTYQQRKQCEDTKLVGNHSEFREIEKLINIAARSDVPVLITGETGTGKTVIARKIHYLSSHSQFPFISINCNSLPEHLFEAELFGHEKGAFTDAKKTRKGIFEMADQSSLLLDEIGCMPIRLQSKILTVLDEKRFKKLGSENFSTASVRIIAATNANLDECIEDGTFREDLYYRLNVVRIHVPPLRERLDDIALLCDHILHQIEVKVPVIMGDGEIELLQQYQWPGNIRELKNILERAVLFKEGDKIYPSSFISKTRKRQVPDNVSLAEIPDQPKKVRPLSDVEQEHIQNAMIVFDGNLTRSAKMLGISLSTLKRKVKQYGILIPGRA